MTGSNGVGTWQTCLFGSDSSVLVPVSEAKITCGGCAASDQPTCCTAATAQCLACSECCSVSDYCGEFIPDSDPARLEACVDHQSPLLGCEFGIGDGSGGTDILIGPSASAAECARLVQWSSPASSGATFPAGGRAGVGACYAEFGMTGTMESTYWQTCMFT
jgi:hypothetical protein